MIKPDSGARQLLDWHFGVEKGAARFAADGEAESRHRQESLLQPKAVHQGHRSRVQFPALQGIGEVPERGIDQLKATALHVDVERFEAEVGYPSNSNRHRCVP